MELFTKTPTEEILTEERLKELINSKTRLRHYIGFEISGLVHLGNGIISMLKVADLQKAGVETTIFLADFHSWINRKLGGDLSLIRKVAGGYFKEALKTSLKIVGGNPDELRIVMGSDLYEKVGVKYLENILRISMKTSLSRVKRSITIMGRKSGEALDFAQLLYVPMQVADIFTLGINIAHGGMDQRKAHVIAIDIGEKLFGYKPIAIHHHILTGIHISERERELVLKAKSSGDKEYVQEALMDIKMSKSKPKTAIFIHDDPEEVKSKVRKAFCPMGGIEVNPILELTKYVIFPLVGDMEIVNAKTGEKKIYATYEELERDFVTKVLHPADLKRTVGETLSEILHPAYKYFKEGAGRKYLEEMETLKVTR